MERDNWTIVCGSAWGNGYPGKESTGMVIDPGRHGNDYGKIGGGIHGWLAEKYRQYIMGNVAGAFPFVYGVPHKKGGIW